MVSTMLYTSNNCWTRRVYHFTNRTILITILLHFQASEVAQHIQSKKDLGCKASSVTTIEETKLKNNGSQRNWKKMVEALGGSCDDAYEGSYTIHW